MATDETNFDRGDQVVAKTYPEPQKPYLIFGRVVAVHIESRTHDEEGERDPAVYYDIAWRWKFNMQGRPNMAPGGEDSVAEHVMESHVKGGMASARMVEALADNQSVRHNLLGSLCETMREEGPGR